MNSEHRAPWECIYAKEDQSSCKPGRKPKSDEEYFEILCLCILQTGLQWGVIRKHWERYREGFYGFDIKRLSEAHMEGVLKKPQVIKNGRKVQAIIDNAKMFQGIRREHGSFSHFLESLRQLTEEEALTVLSKRFKHVGRYTAEYYLHAVGYWE